MTSRIASTALFLAAALLALAPPIAPAADDPSPSAQSGMLWLVSPLCGWNTDKMEVHTRGGQVETATDTSPEYGLFALAAHPRFVVNDFLFFTEASSDTEVMGNFFHANLYGDPDSTLTWNVGAGHLYHKIAPQNEDIEVSVPLAKVGPVLRVKPWGLTFNPFIGYAWERIAMLHSDTDNDSCLYGIAVDWRWRMVNLNVKYYYQDSQEMDDDFNNVHVRLTAGITRHWGATLRFDYMEHVTTDDTSVLVGPVYVF
jgi:hypothetical protein